MENMLTDVRVWRVNAALCILPNSSVFSSCLTVIVDEAQIPKHLIVS